MIRYTESDVYMSKKKKCALCGVVEYVSDVIPSSEELRDDAGNFIAQFLSGPQRWEKRLELRKKLESLRDKISSSECTESVIN